MKKGYDERLLEKGKLKEVTVLFGDIRGFTAMSEKLHPEEVVEMLNTYLEEITAVIFKYKSLVSGS